MLNEMADTTNRKKSKNQKFVWLDLEMTGLNQHVHKIIEIAIIVTDKDLTNPIEGPNLVIGATHKDLALMDEVVTKMHNETGLTQEALKSKIKAREAEIEIIKFIRAHVPKPSKTPICGNSVGMDRRFLQKHMPELESMMNFRIVDVSSVRLIGEELSPGTIKAWKKYRNTEQAVTQTTKHRAMDDTRWSIEELRFYYNHWLKKNEACPSFL